MLDTKNVMRITCLVLLGALGGCTQASSGDATSTVRWGNGGRWAAGAMTDAVVGAPVGATVSAVVGTTTLAAGAYCEASPAACSEVPRSVLSLSPTMLPGARWMLAAEHTKGKRSSTWDKHTKTRSGGKEKKDDRMRFSHGADDSNKEKKEEAKRKKEEEKRQKEEARLKKEEERIKREEDRRKKESAKK
ncbi:putative lipoprotein [Myxococcus xanthus DK 1622]|uniref:Lipoprotein n=1 Tax=Myxococcus xanthus (strain DK1622) TaxID=246197 RepID=Q1DGA9_MYXXD|nr:MULTISPECIES: hypothetical protein [Myxococcus]ABF88733.1 putative lipoprotein [Myxococcus xanthus DK 1622]NOJ54789.1 hypothetical protein [Myxococcus xanthus]QPM79754.1 hypothetical protein I5Q59_00160 [Myxococcus xanthus]QVW68834.1 hypothetical protein JTM82_04545 [Myxococcus xanthus DZ2]QZZ47594.1 hypothetical protein MyxoNM_00160 [Myxococcus xanthus]